jgi:hypothetical protein
MWPKERLPPAQRPISGHRSTVDRAAVRVEADRRLQIKDWEEGPSKSETRACRSQTSREEKENGINALFDNDIPFRAEFHRNISDWHFSSRNLN